MFVSAELGSACYITAIWFWSGIAVPEEQQPVRRDDHMVYPVIHRNVDKWHRLPKLDGGTFLIGDRQGCPRGAIPRADLLRDFEKRPPAREHTFELQRLRTVACKIAVCGPVWQDPDGPALLQRRLRR